MNQLHLKERGRSAMHTGVIARIGRVARLALAGLCAVIGVIGLLLPIIPGILFLALAAWLLGRGTRARGERASYLRYQGLGPGQRIRLRLLLAARFVVDALARRMPGER
ncbi:MAG: hypothetical protein WD396_11615 [Pseudohongiellaceae bacterium]